MRTIAEYEAASEYPCGMQPFLELAGTRIILAEPGRFASDYALAEPDDVLNALLLKCGSVISEPHGQANPVHDVPRTTGALRMGYRPPRYGRAAIFMLSDGTARSCGLVDVKGCGVAAGRVPDLGTTNTGVVFLHEALVEIINAAVLRRLFDRDAMSGLDTTAFYAVVDTGIRAPVAWAETPLPCATLVRRAEIRPKDNNELPLSGSAEERVHHDIERYLLSRGLTTTGNISTLTVVREDSRWISRLDGKVARALEEDVILRFLHTLSLSPPQIIHFSNVQVAREVAIDPLQARLIDLGHIRATRELAGHLVTFVDDRMLNWGKTTLKGSPSWPRPDLERAICDVRLGRKLPLDGDMPGDVVEWLRPTRAFSPDMAGVVLEALCLAKTVTVDGLSEEELKAHLERIAVEAVP